MASPNGEPRRPTLRADAERRRVRLIEAAAQLFCREGLGIPMERVAAEAGVGVATLYRRFPDREALITGVVIESLSRMLARLDEADTTDVPAWAIITSLSEGQDTVSLALRGRLAENPDLARQLRRHEEIRGLQKEISGRLGALVARAQQEGDIRSDIGTGDAVLMLYVISRAEAPSYAAPRAQQRLRELLLASLTSTPGASLTMEPLTMDEVWGLAE